MRSGTRSVGARLALEHARLVERLQRARIAADDDQEARRALEAVLAVGADLAGDAARAQELDGTARRQRRGQVDVHLDRSARQQVERPGVAHDPRELRQPAVRLGRQHLGELGADVFSERHGRRAHGAAQHARARARAPRGRGGSRPRPRSGRPRRARPARPAGGGRTRPGSSRSTSARRGTMMLSTTLAPTCWCSRSTWCEARYPIVSPGCCRRLQTYMRRPRALSTARPRPGTSSGGSVDVNSDPGPITIRSARSTAASACGLATASAGLRKRRRTFGAVARHRGLSGDVAAVVHLGQQGRRVRRRGHDAALDCEHAADLRDGGVERADDLGQRRQEDVAEGVPGQLAAVEAVAEEPVHQRLVLGQRDQAVADVARRRHREIAAQAAARAAVVGQRHDRRDLRARELEPAQQRREARAAAEGDDAQLAARAHVARSSASSRCLKRTPWEPYSPSEPSERTTRWAGRNSSSGQRAQNAPAARGALGRPARAASSP